MAIYSLAQRTTNFTQGQGSVEWIAPSGLRPNLLEISLWQATATATSLGFGRFAVPGITPVQVLFQRDDSTDPVAQSSGSLSWGTSPTVPAQYLRRWNTAAAIGESVIWTFPRGVNFGVSASIGMFNVSTAVAMDVNCVIDE